MNLFRTLLLGAILFHLPGSTIGETASTETFADTANESTRRELFYQRIRERGRGRGDGSPRDVGGNTAPLSETRRGDSRPDSSPQSRNTKPESEPSRGNYLGNANRISRGRAIPRETRPETAPRGNFARASPQAQTVPRGRGGQPEAVSERETAPYRSETPGQFQIVSQNKDSVPPLEPFPRRQISPDRPEIQSQFQPISRGRGNNSGPNPAPREEKYPDPPETLGRFQSISQNEDVEQSPDRPETLVNYAQTKESGQFESLSHKVDNFRYPKSDKAPERPSTPVPPPRQSNLRHTPMITPRQSNNLQSSPLISPRQTTDAPSSAPVSAQLGLPEDQTVVPTVASSPLVSPPLMSSELATRQMANQSTTPAETPATMNPTVISTAANVTAGPISTNAPETTVPAPVAMPVPVPVSAPSPIGSDRPPSPPVPVPPWRPFRGNPNLPIRPGSPRVTTRNPLPMFDRVPDFIRNRRNVIIRQRGRRQPDRITPPPVSGGVTGGNQNNEGVFTIPPLLAPPLDSGGDVGGSQNDEFVFTIPPLVAPSPVGGDGTGGNQNNDNIASSEPFSPANPATTSPGGADLGVPDLTPLATEAPSSLAPGATSAPTSVPQGSPAPPDEPNMPSTQPAAGMTPVPVAPDVQPGMGTSAPSQTTGSDLDVTEAPTVTPIANASTSTPESPVLPGTTTEAPSMMVPGTTFVPSALLPGTGETAVPSASLPGVGATAVPSAFTGANATIVPSDSIPGVVETAVPSGSIPGANVSIPGMIETAVPSDSIPGANVSIPGVIETIAPSVSIPGANVSIPGVIETIAPSVSIPGTNASIPGVIETAVPFDPIPGANASIPGGIATAVPSDLLPGTAIPSGAVGGVGTGAPTTAAQCVDNPGEIQVGIDVQLLFSDGLFQTCTETDLFLVSQTIEVMINAAFPTAVPDWQGTALFGPVTFDTLQTVDYTNPLAAPIVRQYHTSSPISPEKGRRNPTQFSGFQTTDSFHPRATADNRLRPRIAKPQLRRFIPSHPQSPIATQPRGQRQRSLQGTCPARPTQCPVTVNGCLFACSTAYTTNCGTGDTTNWANLGIEVAIAIATLNLPCMGAPNVPNVVVNTF